MRNFAILGYPLGHSLSPQLHSLLFELSGHEAAYSVLQLPPEDLPKPQTLQHLRSLHGFNVTIPYKGAIIPFLDKLDESAQRYGAVNTVLRRGDELIGYNTDADGFLGSMQQAGVPLSGHIAILGGAGGAGRMFTTACALAGAAVSIVVRQSSHEAAQNLAQTLADANCTRPVVCSPEELTGSIDLLINATPVGMYPNTNAMPIDAAVLKQVRTVFDCVYNPKQTLLMRTAQEAGCQCVGGMPMLVWQAAAAHKLWDNANYSAKELLGICKKLEKVLE